MTDCNLTLAAALQIAGFCLGLLYLWLEYRADIRLWIVGLIMPLIHGVLYYRSGLYADAAMQTYYVAAGIYGWIIWRGRPKKNTKTKIAHTPKQKAIPLIATTTALWALISFILVRFTDSTVPYFDAATTAASITAMWMLSRKFVEQWLVWLTVDVVSCGLYIYKGIPLTAALYGFYAVLAVVGYRRWLGLVKE